MMPDHEKLLQRAYSRFGEDHDALRHQLLERIGQEPLPFADASEKQMALHRFRPWLAALSIGLAAFMMLGIGQHIWTRWICPPGAAMTLPVDLSSVRGIVTPGWQKTPATTRFD